MATIELENYFKDYEKYHQTKGNIACHWIGIPGVTFSLIGLLSYVTILDSPSLNLGLVVWAIGSGFAFRADRKLALSYVPFMFVMYYAAKQVSLPVLTLIQILSWILQFFGHLQFEKKSPAFLKNLESLFVGPMWTYAKLIGYYRP